LAGGDAAFARILRKIDEARRTIFIRCFGWRDDETGAIVARHLLHAADRGVAVTILKDRVGMHYEYLEGTKQSFFHKELDVVTRVQTWFLMAAYRQWGRLRQRANPLMTALLEHHQVTVVHDQKRFDHSKLYVFDDEVLILGGMGIGDDYRFANVDFMVEITGRDAVARFVDRDAGRVPFDPARDLDFLIGSRRAPQPDGDTLVAQRVRLIRGARRRLTIEMAYLGDRRCTDAVADAVDRGVDVTLLTAERANIIRDVNLHTCDDLLRRTRAPENLRIFLHPRMVHGKAIVVDSKWVDIGSANFTALSHDVYEEVNLYRRDPAFARAVESAIESDILGGRPAPSPVPYRRVRMLVERAFVSHQTRKGKHRQAAALARKS
jgi:phosphatidylserine/phosphatidylglycerophosphate/cardiolipin synthase-like enzyme